MRSRRSASASQSIDAHAPITEGAASAPDDEFFARWRRRRGAVVHQAGVIIVDQGNEGQTAWDCHAANEETFGSHDRVAPQVVIAHGAVHIPGRNPWCSGTLLPLLRSH